MSPHFHSFAKGRADKAPTESWWVGLDRDAFYAKVAADTERMRLSTFGAIEGLSYAPIDPGREERWRKARQERMDETRRGLTEGAA